MQNHLDGDSCNFVCLSHISGNSLCRRAHCVELLEYNYIFGTTFLPKTDAELHVHCNRIIPSIPLRRSDYLGVHALVVCGLNTTINLKDISN